MLKDKFLEIYGLVHKMSNDIEWLKGDALKHNGVLEKHLSNTTICQSQVIRNTAWRHAFKFILGGLAVVLGWLLMKG